MQHPCTYSWFTHINVIPAEGGGLIALLVFGHGIVR